MPDFQHIDEERLEQDVGYRVSYLSDFMGFGPDDIAVIHGAASHLAPLVSVLVDAVYDKLFSYDATKRHFVARQSGYDGEIPDSVEALEQSHAMIEFRKQHLGRYLVALVTRDYDEKMIGYLDMVGRMHTPKAGSTELDVPLVQMNALMGFVSDALTNVILNLGLDRDMEIKTLRAFNRLLWIQNDLITRHYQGTSSPVAAVA